MMISSKLYKVTKSKISPQQTIQSYPALLSEDVGEELRMRIEIGFMIEI